MQDLDMETVRINLEKRLQELQLRMENVEHELEHPKSRDWSESAQEAEGDEVLEELGNNSLQEIRAIEAALGRIDDDSYGICMKCGDEIAVERLALVPFAPFCNKCAQK